MEAAWKVRASDDEDALLDTLEKAVRFVRQQRGEHNAAVAALEEEIYAPLDIGGGVAIPLGAARSTAEEVANLPRIPMMSPSALSDRPSDGGPPPVSTFNWRDMPTAITPDLAAKAASDGTPMGWEMIPPGEQ